MSGNIIVAQTSKALELRDLLSSFQTLLKSGRHSDLIIECQERQFKVHKAIVCPRSSVLASMMKDDCKEQEIGLIELDEDYPDMIEKMIEFLYTLHYDDNRDQHGHNDNYNHDPRFDFNFPTDDSFYDDFFPSVQKLMKAKAKSALSAVRKPEMAPEPKSGQMPQQAPQQASQQTPQETPQQAPQQIPQQAHQQSFQQVYQQIYKQSYQQSLDIIEGPLLTNAHLFILGEYYDIPSLRYYAKCQYEETVERRWDSEFFFKSVDMVYEKCLDAKDQSLKEVMIQTARNNIKVLLKREKFVKLLKVHGKFSYDVLRDCGTEGPRAAECNCHELPKYVTVKNSCSFCHQNLSA